MKKRTVAVMAAGLFLLGACGSPKASDSGGSDDAKTIKIGGNFELSGAVAAYGEAENEGVKLAVEEINKDGGIDGKKIEYVSKDNKSDNNEAASVAANLTTKDEVVAIVGPATSGATKATLPNLTKAKSQQ